jgi:hypothetical protein
MLVDFMAIWSILWPLWYIFPRFGILYHENSGNPGTYLFIRLFWFYDLGMKFHTKGNNPGMKPWREKKCCEKKTSVAWVNLSAHPNFRIAAFPHFRISAFPNFRISKFPNFQISKFPNFQISEFPNFRILKLTETRHVQFNCRNIFVKNILLLSVFLVFFFNWCSFYLKEKPHCLCT